MISSFCRTNSLRGGVAIHCNKFLKYNPLENLNYKFVEITCELSECYIKDTKMLLITIYPSPNGNLDHFLMVLEDTLLDVFNKYNVQTKITLNS